MKKLVSSAALGIAASLCSLFVAQPAEAQTAVVLGRCRPVQADAGTVVVLRKDVICTAEDIAKWGSEDALITANGRAAIYFNGYSISTQGDVGKAVTGLRVRGKGVLVIGGIGGGRGKIQGFSRAARISGANHVITAVDAVATRVAPLAIGTQGQVASAAVTLENASNVRVEDVSISGAQVAPGTQAPFTAALALWGDVENGTSNNTIRRVVIAGNQLLAVQGDAPAALPSDPNVAPAAPPGPPAINDPTPNGGGAGQTLATGVLVWGAGAANATTANTLSQLSISGNSITSDTTEKAALAGLLSFESTTGNIVDGVSIQGNGVLSASAVNESQAGLVAITESAANTITNITATGNSVRAGRAAAAAVIAVGQSNALSQITVQGNAFLAGSFTGGVFFYGEVTNGPSRFTVFNETSDVTVSQNFFQSSVGNAGLFLFSSFMNNFHRVTVAANTYVFFGLDVFDLGLGFPGAPEPACSATPYSPFTAPGDPLANHYENISAQSAVPYCALLP